MEMLYIYALQYGNNQPNAAMEFLKYGEYKELNFKFYFILINLRLNLNDHIWLTATLLDSELYQNHSFASWSNSSCPSTSPRMPFLTAKVHNNCHFL